MTDFLDPEQVREWLDADPHSETTAYGTARANEAMEQFVRAQAKERDRIENTPMGAEARQWEYTKLGNRSGAVARVIVEAIKGGDASAA